MTAVLGIKAAGIHYLNPFVLSSAPPTGSREMIERALTRDGEVPSSKRSPKMSPMRYTM